jgi:hypothetical protein
MLIAMVPAVNVTNVQAATVKKSLTLYKGEAIYFTDYSTVKSVSSSKKSVVTVKKDSERDYRANITAKKTGKATLTMKTKSKTYKYTITVKKLDVTAKITDMGNGYLLLTVKNNTKNTFTSVDFSYTLKNEQGEVVKSDTRSVSNVVAGKTVYDYISYDNYSYDVDPSKCSAKATGVSRDPDATYKNVSSKVTYTVTEDDNGSDTLTLSVKSKNTLKKDYARGYHYILVYDADNNVIGLKTINIYLKAGAVNTDTAKIYYGPYGYQYGYDHYKVVTVAYTY